MWWETEMIPNAERQQWAWDPLKGVGPLRFGQSVHEVAEVLMEPVSGWDRKAQWAPFSTTGIDTYYMREEGTLAAVAIDACCGPQVSYKGIDLVGRLPSELTPWIEETAETLDDLSPGLQGLHIGLNGEAGLPGLGLVMRCQQNGDYARSRPVFVSSAWAENSADSEEGPIPAREWGVY